jgi:uncharacterized protein YkwD
VTARPLGILLAAVAACATAGPAIAPPRPDPHAAAPLPRDATEAERAFEARALAEVRRSLSTDSTTLRSAPELDLAARALARLAAHGDPTPLSGQRIQGALRGAGAFDPAPVAMLATGADDEALAALLARVVRDGATHAGIGDAQDDRAHHLVLLLSRRRARLEPFPSRVAPGAEALLAGELVGLLHPRVFVTRPDGSSDEVALEGGRAFRSRIRFAVPGRYAIELVGTGAAGPEVAALLDVSVGEGSREPDPRPALGPEPEDASGAEALVIRAANRIRRERDLTSLIPSAELAEVARRHSERMLAASRVAHVLPGSGELVDRLGAARVPYRRAFENLARGESALAAHAAIEASPAHRSNLLVPAASRIGVGVARGALPAGEPVVYVTEILVEPPPEPALDRLTPDARVREVLWRERERRGLPPLTADAALEALARTAANRVRDSDGGEAEGLAEGALRLRRGIAAADAFVASDPGEVVRSRNIADPRFKRVGVGVVIGESRRFGPGRLFIAVVYTD